MKLRNFGVLMAAILIVFSLISGCSNLLQQAGDKSSLEVANDKLAAGDLDGAYADYQAILAADPTNAEANLGVAVLEVMSLAVDDETRSLASAMGLTLPDSLNDLYNEFASPETSSALALTLKAANLKAAGTSFISISTLEGVTVSQIQAYLRNSVIPRINQALARLAIVESNSDFQYMLPADLTGAETDLEIDLTEIYLLDAIGNALKGICYHLIAYNLDYSTSNPFLETGFGTLETDGAADMENARLALVAAAEKSIAALNFNAAETDDQSNDVLPQMDSADLTQILAIVGKIKDSLQSGEQTIEITETYSLAVNLKTYFMSPIADLKDYYFQDENDNSTIDAGDFPTGYDFTVNGLLPGLTSFTAWETFISKINSLF
ncbi:MAG: hypothetical protein KKA31_00360 [Candidatus Margulisbacteria bacterium]|nr:hypothetical protein [Candidatus Margulisiibacteriota bacterium]